MKLLSLVVAMVVAALTSPVLAADVGVSISIGQPGFYGRLDLGDLPPPPVIDPRPVIIERNVPVDRPPVYLRVPSKHMKYWKKYCHRYNACGERVIFVNDDWYNREYIPHYRDRHHERMEERHEDWAEHREERRGDRVERRDERREDRLEHREERREERMERQEDRRNERGEEGRGERHGNGHGHDR